MERPPVVSWMSVPSRVQIEADGTSSPLQGVYQGLAPTGDEVKVESSEVKGEGQKFKINRQPGVGLIP